MLLILLLLADRVLPKVSSRGSNIEGVRVGSRAESVTGHIPSRGQIFSRGLWEEVPEKLKPFHCVNANDSHRCRRSRLGFPALDSPPADSPLATPHPHTATQHSLSTVLLLAFHLNVYFLLSTCVRSDLRNICREVLV